MTWKSLSRGHLFAPFLFHALFSHVMVGGKPKAACCLSVVTCGPEWNSYSVSGYVRQNLNLRSLDIDLSSDRSGRDKSVRVRHRSVLVIWYVVSQMYISVGSRLPKTNHHRPSKFRVVEGRSAEDAAPHGSRAASSAYPPPFTSTWNFAGSDLFR